jgi:hypothetical protein
MNTIVFHTARILLGVVVFSATIAISPNATAQQRSGCFIGKDHLGYPAKVYVKFEKYGNSSIITGKIYSSGTKREYSFNADGYSGAGRLYERYEYEASALYISVKQLTEANFILQVEPIGVFNFRRTSC